MKDATKEKVEAETADWQFAASLPADWHGFTFRKEMYIDGDRYELFSYSDESRHRKITVYYHEETKEYKLRVRIGLTEFCRIDCISSKFEEFEKLLKERMERILLEFEQFQPETLTSIVKEKRITEWDYQKFLPAEYKEFTLFINPSEPVRITNGSFIIADYEDFAGNNNFIIYYNLYRDEFCGEARIKMIPDVTYEFDSPTIASLEKKLTARLLPRLDEILLRAGEEEKK